MKVLFVNDSTSNPNWGDRAAATALRMMISDVGGSITYSLSEGALASTLLDDGVPVTPAAVPDRRRLRKGVKHIVPPGLVSIARRMKPRPHLIPEVWEDFPERMGVALGSKQPWPAFTRALQDTDIVVIHADGAVTGNGIAPRTMFFIAYLAKKGFDKPVVIVNHTADLSHPRLREIACNVYPLVDDVVYRDPISEQRYGQRCGGRYAADATFVFQPASRATWASLAGRPTYFDVWPDVAAFDPSQPYLCIGGSSVLAHADDPTAVHEGYRALIQRIRMIYDGSVVLTVSDVIDQPIFRSLAGELRLPLVGLRTPIQQVIDILGNADAYIGGRWHPSIFALRGGTPIVPLSAKTAKMQALATMVGLTAPLPNAFDLASAIDPLGRQVQACLDGGPDLRDRLRAWAAEQALSCGQNVAYLEQM